MRDECEHGSLRRSCEICELTAENANLTKLLEESEKEMLFWRHLHWDVTAENADLKKRIQGMLDAGRE